VAPTGAFLALHLRNAGNTLVERTSGRVAVLQKGRRLFSQPVRVDSFVPGTEISYPVPWRGRPVEGDYEVRGMLRPKGAAPIRFEEKVEFERSRIKEFRRETGKPATESRRSSPALLAVLALVTVLAVLLGAAYLRLLRRVSG
jgi:hypothetical protein